MKFKATLLMIFLSIGITSGCTSNQLANIKADVNSTALILQQGLQDYQNNKATVDAITSQAIDLALKTGQTHSAAIELLSALQIAQDPAAIEKAKAQLATIISNTTSK